MHGTGHPVAGVFANFSRLNNDGETIKLEDALNGTIKEFTYNDVAPWPTAADAGYSLVLIDPASNPAPTSPAAGARAPCPAATPTPAMRCHSRPIHSAMPTTTGSATSSISPWAASSACPRSHRRSLGSTTTSAVLAGVATMSYPISLGAEGVEVGIDASTDLSNWSDAAANTEFVSQTNLGDGRALVTVRFTSPIGDGARQFLRLRVEAGGESKGAELKLASNSAL